MVEANAFSTYKLAGSYPGKSPEVVIPFYSKGCEMIIDGNYTCDLQGLMSGDPSKPAWVKPGRMGVFATRRSRVTTDRIITSSENPVAWGKITAIKDNKLTIEAPQIKGVPVSGKQTFTIDADAEYFHLGLKINKTKAIKVGSWIHIYPKRPQTILVNGE